MDAQIRERIARAIENNDVLLFMKGTRQAPQCGFSARTVEILDSLLPEYATVDVLAHPEIREGIKEYSSWPTIPQLYVRGEFIGGADIVAQLFESGELHRTLGFEGGGEIEVPELTVTERAAEALRAALQSAEECICLEIDRDFQPGLSVGPAPAGAVVVESRGVRVALDRLSAGRAQGVVIDYVDTPQGPAFKIDNPNEPPRVQPMTALELKSKLDAGEKLVLVDVRTPGERATAHIVGSRLFDDAFQAELLQHDPDEVLVFQCHHGHRSQRAAERFVQAGFRRVYNLVGGIDAWSLDVDPTVPRY
jgi:monothiol glutaredoxin